MLLDENCTSTLNSTLSDENNLTFQDVILNPVIYGGIIIFIIIILCTRTFIYILKSRKRWLF